MNKAYSRINWENYPSTDTPLNETNLNHMDLAVDTIDDRVITLDTTKANESDLLTCVASISFNSTTGIMTITLKNGTQGTIDTGLSKLAINFDYDDDPTSPHYQQIILEMKDGTYKYIDLSALITQYEFTNSSTIAWTIGNDGTVSASVVDGSITANKLQPNYLADIIVEVGKAQTAATNANADSLEAEGWAVGEQNGVPVTSGSPYFENNAKYYAQRSGGTALSALTDVQLSTPTNGQALVYDANSGKWVNGEGGMHIIQIPVPTLQTYTYNGSIQTFQFDSVDTQHITISGDSQSQAGTYVVTATLKSANDVWSDLTNAPKTFTWTIAKAQGSFSLDSHSVVVNSGTPTATVNVSSIVGDGVISVASDDDNIATASISNGVITITGVGTGTATITVTMADSSNYLGNSHTISVTATFTFNKTLTINSAYEDTVTVVDEIGTKTCVISGGTQGTLVVNVSANKEYTFYSDIAKIGQLDFFKKVKMDGNATQTIDLMMPCALEWYGNACLHNNAPDFTNTTSFTYTRSNLGIEIQRGSGAYSVPYRNILLSGTYAKLKVEYNAISTPGSDYVAAYGVLDSNEQGTSLGGYDSSIINKILSAQIPSGVTLVSTYFAIGGGSARVPRAWLEKLRTLSTYDTISVTVNGAKEDKITVYDKNWDVVGYIDFASGQTSATANLQIAEGGEEVVFFSSVSNYAKVVTLSGASQTVNVMPTIAPLWYLNGYDDFTAYDYRVSWNGDTRLAPTKSQNGNATSFSLSGIQKCGSAFLSAIDLTDVSNIKIHITSATAGGAYSQAVVSITNTLQDKFVSAKSGSIVNAQGTASVSDTTLTYDVSDLTGLYYIGLYIYSYDSTTTVNIDRIYSE